MTQTATKQTAHEKKEKRAEVAIYVEEQLTEEQAQEKDKFLRLFAEFENYKRRTSKERVELFSTASQDVIQALLPVLDDFDRAMLEISKHKESELSKGVELIQNKLNNTLQQKGLSIIVVQTGDEFNADDHEAISQIPAPTEDLKGQVIDITEQG